MHVYDRSWILQQVTTHVTPSYMDELEDKVRHNPQKYLWWDDELTHAQVIWLENKKGI